MEKNSMARGLGKCRGSCFLVLVVVLVVVVGSSALASRSSEHEDDDDRSSRCLQRPGAMPEKNAAHVT